MTTPRTVSPEDHGVILRLKAELAAALTEAERYRALAAQAETRATAAEQALRLERAQAARERMCTCGASEQAELVALRARVAALEHTLFERDIREIAAPLGSEAVDFAEKLLDAGKLGGAA